MRHDFKTGDLVLLIGSTYHPELVGHAGTVAHGEDLFTGHDAQGHYISGRYVVVDLPDDINRFGTTLWYLKAQHLIRLYPDDITSEGFNHSQTIVDSADRIC